MLDLLYKFFLRDASGSQAWYEPISVIDYRGSIASSGETQGHYTCDVKDVKTSAWFRTNDFRNPAQIQTSEVSKHGYVVLYKQLPM